MNLFDVVENGGEVGAQRIIVYGPGGVGKTWFGASAPKPVFLCTEEGLGSLSVKRFPGRPKGLEDVINAIESLINGKHEFQTLVIDSLDRLSELISADVCRDKGVESLGDVDFGKLYEKLLPRHKRLIAKLDELRDRRGMHVICICHAQNRTVANPEGPDFDKIDLKLPETKNVKISDLWKEEADVVAYMALPTAVAVNKDSKGGKAKGGGRAVLRCGPSVSFAAKNRYGLPDAITPSWSDLYTFIQASVGVSVEAAIEEINSIRELLSEEDVAKLDSYFPTIQGDSKKLNELLKRLKDRVNQ